MHCEERLKAYCLLAAFALANHCVFGGDVAAFGLSLTLPKKIADDAFPAATTEDVYRQRAILNRAQTPGRTQA